MEHKTWICTYQEPGCKPITETFENTAALCEFTKILDKRLLDGSCEWYRYNISRNGG